MDQLRAPRDVDPRVQRTRRALNAALDRLAATQALDQVGVTELCREARVHRTTFYGHFSSVHEFAVSSFTEQIRATLSDPAVGDRDLDAAAVAAHYDAAFARLLAEVLARRPLYRAVLAAPLGDAFRTALAEALAAPLQHALDRWVERGEVPPSAGLPTTSAFLSAGLAGAVIAWVLDDSEDVAAASAAIMSLSPSWWPA